MPTGVLLLALVAQAVTTAAPETADLERIRKGLSHQPAMTTEAGTDESGRPIFRMTVGAPWPEKPIWDNWTNVPSYIRPFWRSYHFEFLEMVTPEEFRSATLYPCCISVDRLMGKLAKEIKAAQRKAQERHARDEVSQALADVLACRADPTRPGC